MRDMGSFFLTTLCSENRWAFLRMGTIGLRISPVSGSTFSVLFLDFASVPRAPALPPVRPPALRLRAACPPAARALGFRGEFAPVDALKTGVRGTISMSVSLLNNDEKTGQRPELRQELLGIFFRPREAALRCAASNT